MSTCGRCSRPLTNPASRERGMGPVCAAQRDAAVEQEKAVSTPPQSWPEFDYQTAINELNKKLSAETVIDDVVYNVERVGNKILALVTPNDLTKSEYPLPHVMYHSPDGYELGYLGSGPADCARSILADSVGIQLADRFYQRFKVCFVAGTKDLLVIRRSTIQSWIIAEYEKEVPHA